jgi:aryl-alcohol dehydrogenase-like predicted oxidoreductase
LVGPPLAGGLVGGRQSSPGVPDAYATVSTAAAIADALGVQPASVAIAWVAARFHTRNSVPRTVDQLAANLGAALHDG